jgi:hypothetical protein
MQASEFSEFESTVRRLEKIFTKKLDDETIQVYWGALRDLSFATFRRFAERHEKFGKFFPKPSELRPKEDKLPPVSDINSLRVHDDIAIRRLEELRQKDPAEWERQVAKVKGADCNAIRLHRQFGERLWYDLPARCWRV